MHLKRLEVSGFKSFADTVKLDFEAGITAVVGPNGCGKSNIIDAIRWCLGEMSAKSLRSSAMMDVVFNGSGSRPPQNMAEVTLTFDNADKRLPIDFSDVSITRRLFRSGESEYFINKTQCRLRDIKELFLDTGMGEDGYSSLEQGKVEWILQAKPEERRELFEEAAGVSKYRARREEALRKLEKVELDLSRIADIVSVTNDQIRKLENAVNKAKTYQRVREELRGMEIGDWLFQLDTIEKELTEVEGRLTDSQRSAEELNTQTHQRNAEVAEHRLALAQHEEALLKANTALNAIDADIKIGEERLSGARRREEDLERQDASLRESILREEGRVAELEAQKAAQGEALDALRTEESGVEESFAAARSHYDAASQQLESKKKQVKEARDLILDRAQERSRLQQQISRLVSDVARLESRAENIQKDKERSQAQIDELARAIQAGEQRIAEQIADVNAKSTSFETLKAQLESLSSRETALRKDLMTATEEIARLKGQMATIRDKQSEDPYLAGAQAVLSAGLPGIQGPIGKLFQAGSADRDIVAASIGDVLADLVADTADDAQRAVDYLKDAEKGRCRVWILDRLAAATEPLGALPTGSPLLSKITFDSKFQPLFASLCAGLYVQGAVVYGRAVVNGGMDPAKWKSHVTHRLPELERELDERNGDRERLTSELTSVTDLLKSAAAQRETATKELQEVRIRLQLAQEERERSAKKKQVLSEEQQVIEMEVAQIQDEKVRAQVQHEETLARFNDLQNQEKDDHDQLDLLQQELTELQQAHARTEADLAGTQQRRSSFRERLNWQSSVLQHTERELDNVRATITRQSQTLSHLAEGKESARASQSEAQALIASSMEKRSGAAAACEHIQSDRAVLAEKIQAAEGELSRLRASLGSAQESAQSELIRQTALKSRNETLQQKLLEQYELTLDAAKAQSVAAAADPETLERLKKRVANMGPINLAAPQEHAELLEKSTFLTTQQDDLVKAKDDLKQVIQKINGTTREHFRETFDKVRENFRALYGTLFQGGEADIRFTDESDILNTGIDIFCQPPGKKLLHISLLSGGEKALTAIALLFAFFQVRPSPIALMDEVDAPLDEANVLRYVDMLKRFSESSQFILISHNKRTMEAANTLYGVTMEELGVSKVLSARLRQAAPAAPAAEPVAAVAAPESADASPANG